MFHRRQFLAAAGCLLPLPWLEALASGNRERAARCVFIHIPLGANMWNWFPRTLGANPELSWSLAPLAPHIDNVTIFSGLHYTGRGFAHAESSYFLTGNPNVDGPLLSGNTISVDQHIARARGHETGLPSLELSVAGGNHTACYDANGARMYGLCDLRAIYERLFGTPTAIADAQRRQSILDVVGRRLRDRTSTLGREDLRRLNQYSDAVATVERQLARDHAYYVETGKRYAATAPGLALDADKLNNVGREAYIDTLYDLAVLALQGDRTRIVTIESPWNSSSEGVFEYYPDLKPRDLPDRIGWHLAGHNLNIRDESQTPLESEYLRKIDRYWVGKLARFLDRLASIEHQGGTLLDHTLVMYGSGMAWGNHTRDHLPVLIAGGRALGIRHRGHLAYNERAQRDAAPPASHLGDLLRTVSEVCGVPARGFGASRRVLDEILA